jgi:hypothetical protein
MNYKKYIISLSFVMLVLLLFSFGVEYFIQTIPTVYKFKYDKIKRNSENFKTIILGSSHTFYGLNPEYFEEPTLNLANVSQDLKYDKYIFDKSIENIKDLKTVILPISYFSLFEDLDFGIEYWRKYFYIHWFDYPAEELLDIINYSIIISYPSKIELLKVVYHYYFKGDFKPTWSDSGWGINHPDEQQEDLVKTGKKYAELDDVKYTNFYNRNLMLLNDMLDICKEKNIKVLLFTPPAYITYRQHLNQKRLDQMVSLLHDVTKLNKNVTYINLIADERFIAKDYFDADHLNHTGAKKLSMILNEYLNK